MIARVKGRLVALEPGRAELETAGGVVYEVHIPLTVHGRLPPPGGDATLLTAHVVQDDAPCLYGFVEESERALFRRLLGVHTVGPRLAMAMLSAYRAGRLARAIASEDASALVQVSGLGKKTAERIILDLADKVGDIAASEGAPDGKAGVAAQAVAALTGLGYTFADADAAVQKAMGQGEAEGSEELVRRVLASRRPARGR